MPHIESMQNSSTKPLVRILHLEDNPLDRDLVAKALAEEGLPCEFVYASSRAEFEQALQQGVYDVILSDFTLPSYSGMAALVTTRELRPEVPFLLVSGTIGVERAVASLKSGATDYVLKDRLDQLPTAVRRAIGEVELKRARRQAEERLRESEQRYRQLVEMCPDAIFIECDGLFVFANPAGLKLFGAACQGELLGTPVMERVHPDHRKAVIEFMARVRLDRCGVAINEQKCLRLDGSVVEVEVMASPFQFGGRPAAQVIVRDISVRKQNEENMRRLSDRLTLATRAASVGIWDMDPVTNKLVWDDAMFGLYGMSPEHFAGADRYDTWRAAIHPEDRERTHGQVQMALRGEKDFDTEFRVLWPDQSVHYIKAFGLVQRDPSGRPVRMLGTNWDVTDRKRQEKRLHELAMIVEHSCDFIAVASLEGQVLYVNPAGRRLVGLDQEDAVKMKRVVDYVIKQGRKRFLKHTWPTLLRQGHWEGEIVFGHFQTGAPIPLLHNTFFITAPGTERPVAVATICRDLREHHALELKLRQSQKMEAIGQLAGGVAHDFNNLLAVIRGNADLLLMDPSAFKPEAGECLKQVVDASERAAVLTRQLLVFSRKEAMHTEPLLLNDLVSNVTKMLKRVIREDIRLESLPAGPLPYVQCDPGMMEQVLLNLVVNARDAMPNGGQLLIATERVVFAEPACQRSPEARPGEYVCLNVTDTGTGIAPEHLPRIFDPFFTTKEPGKGTGLGLATVYGIVKQHNGWLEVASHLGEGTSFKIFLPAIAPPRHAAQRAQTELALDGGTETILLVEDDYSVRMITRRILETFKYKVYEATCAREALEIWSKHAEEIALLLTDIIMPEGVTGHDLAVQIRPQKPNLKVILMSGYSWDVLAKDFNRFRRNKMHFLQKPCSSTTLIQTVRRSLETGLPVTELASHPIRG